MYFPLQVTFFGGSNSPSKNLSTFFYVAPHNFFSAILIWENSWNISPTLKSPNPFELDNPRPFVFVPVHLFFSSKNISNWFKFYLQASKHERFCLEQSSGGNVTMVPFVKIKGLNYFQNSND